MTVTFTNVTLPLDPENITLESLGVMKELKLINASNSLSVSLQVHITGANADSAIEKIRQLEALGVISNYKTNEAVNQIESLKAFYLK